MIPLTTEDSTSARYLTVREVAGTLRVSNMTVYRLINAGELPAVRVGGHRVVSRRALLGHLGVSAADSAGSDPVGSRPAWASHFRTEVPVR